MIRSRARTTVYDVAFDGVGCCEEGEGEKGDG